MLPGPVIIGACPLCGAAHRAPSWASANTFGAQLWSDGKVVGGMYPSLQTLAGCGACGGWYWGEDAPVLAEMDSLRGQLLPSGFDVVVEHAGIRKDDLVRTLAEHLRVHRWRVAWRMRRVPATVATNVLACVKDALWGACRMMDVDVRFHPNHSQPQVPDAVVQQWRVAPERGLVPPSALRRALSLGLGNTLAREVSLRIAIWQNDNDPFRGEVSWVPGCSQQSVVPPWIPMAQRAEAQDNLERLLGLMARCEDGERLRLLRAEGARQLRRFDEAIALASCRPLGNEEHAAWIVGLARRGVDALSRVEGSESSMAPLYL